MSEVAPYLSVVIPAYNEEKRIAESLSKAKQYLGVQKYIWEVIVVDDGSQDGTAAMVEDFSRQHSTIHLIRAPHRGKGATVREGMLAARGEYRFMCDADLSMPIEQIDRFLPPRLTDFDVAIGSREAVDSQRIDEPQMRHLMGRLYNYWIRLAAVPAIQDTQCGFKCFRGSVAEELFRLQRLPGWAFDGEILFLALRRKMRIVEVAIDWFYREESKINRLGDSYRMFRDVLKIRWNHMLGRYRVESSD